MIAQTSCVSLASQLAMIEVMLNDPEGRKHRDEHRLAAGRLLRSIAGACENKEDRAHIAMIKRDCDTFFGEASLSEERTDCRALIAFHLKALRKNIGEPPRAFQTGLAAWRASQPFALSNPEPAGP